MRAIAILAILLLGGCITAQPDAPEATNTTGIQTSVSQPLTTSAAPCHYGATALWRETGVFARAKNASFPSVAPQEGLRVTEPGLVGTYGSLNLSRIIRQGPGVTGTLGHLTFIAFPEPIIGGDFQASATQDDLKREFLAFAEPLLASTDETLRSLVDQFGNSTLREPGGFEHWVKVGGPFKTDAFLAATSSKGVERGGGAVRVVWRDGAWLSEAFVLYAHREPIRVNQADLMEFFAGGMKDRAGAWNSANKTFESYGWPHPDLANATVWCS